MLSVGIIGLPNVGKSTLFNALTEGRAEVSNYPFTTIDCNIGMVPVPDQRLDLLAQLLQPVKVTPCAVRFTDIAGLVKGASQGEGLGNQFLGEIRGVDALAHVLRCFDGGKIAHVLGDIGPLRDAEVVETELLLADLEVLERIISKRQKDWQTHPREHQEEQQRLLRYRDSLERGVPLRRLELSAADRAELKAIGLLTGKPLLYVANVSDATDQATADLLEQLRQLQPDTEAIAMTADLEWELQALEPEERQELMAEMGLAEPGQHRLVRSCFSLLGLICFYTIVKQKLQAWEIPDGTRAPQAAGKVHSDMERGFIRAQVVSWQELQEHGDLQQLQSKGLVRTVGKDYEINDGDVVEFLFHV